MNGLVTDLQMYALKTLHIPLPGRHPPSPILKDDSASNGYCFLFFVFLFLFKIFSPVVSASNFD